jgi:hypothetical protein
MPWHVEWRYGGYMPVTGGKILWRNGYFSCFPVGVWILLFIIADIHQPLDNRNYHHGRQLQRIA